MAKLIFEKGVVEERADLNPVTGRWRVVYERQGEGGRFKCMLDEDEDFVDGRRGLAAVLAKPFTTSPDYVVYAVSQDKHLLLDFTERVQHQNHLNHFDLTLTLTYYISDPKLLIRQLRASSQNDPLTRLHDTAFQEVGGACARLAWETINDEYEFAKAAADLTAPASPAARAVHSMARDLGLAVSDIKVGLRLMEEDVLEARRRREHEFLLAEQQRKLEETRAKENIKDEEEMRRQRRNVAEAITDSVRSIIGGTENVDKLRNTVNSLGPLNMPSLTDPGAVAPPPDGNKRLLREKPSRGSGAGGSLLEEIIDLICELDLRERERRKVLAAAYHLAAELLAADEARPDALAYYQEKYRTRLEELETDLRTQQYDTLARLLEIEHL
ncbi:MAG: hypothetical protein QOH49_2330 [Acidobacteriota bacterium]|jgi:hypothetical protein|nr:hypothetical protein [Acidobacteriota bacterium]